MKYFKLIILFSFLLSTATTGHCQIRTPQSQARDTLPMKMDTLQPALVTAKLRPHLKGDTLEYNTRQIQLNVHANVEELLAQLPGLRIASDGSITYNGEKIQHLFVNGEDIFSSEPTIITRNFDGSKIEKVQIINQKSDLANFTGVDDGVRTKAINLVLKESAKDGYFGKTEIGGNAEGYYNANGVIAAFKDKEQLTGLGIASNIGTVGFSSNEGNSSASIHLLSSGSDPLGASAGVGIPKFNGVALHYANSWNSQSDHFVANYQYSSYLTRPLTSSLTIQVQPGEILNQSQQSKSVNSQMQHWSYGTYDWMPNLKSAFKLMFHTNNMEGSNQLNSTAATSTNNLSLNSNQRSIKDMVNGLDIGGLFFWRYQLGKAKDRKLSINIGITQTTNITNGFLYSLTQYYNSNNLPQNIDTVDQRKYIATHSVFASGSINYTEPLWKNALLGVSYGISMSRDAPQTTTFAQADGKYMLLIDSLSSDLQTEAINQHGTLTFQGKVKNLTYSIGNDWLPYSYRQNDLISDSISRFHYFNWAPRIFLNYSISQSESLSFNYNASTQQASPSQLSPVKNNTDPTHITLGNPNLKPESMQTLRLDFSSLKACLINVTMDMSIPKNSISSQTNTDSLGLQISRPVNVNGTRMVDLNFSISKNMSGIDVSLFSSTDYSRSFNYVNNLLGQNNSYTSSWGLSLSKYAPNKFSLQFNNNFAYFYQVNSINPSSTTHYWSQSSTGKFTLFINNGFEINMNANYSWQEKPNDFGQEISILLWNANISKSFINNKLLVKFQLNNLLNQNAGITRTTIDNTYSETSTNILGRYWILNASWHFDKKFKHELK